MNQIIKKMEDFPIDKCLICRQNIFNYSNIKRCQGISHNYEISQDINRRVYLSIMDANYQYYLIISEKQIKYWKRPVKEAWKSSIDFPFISLDFSDWQQAVETLDKMKNFI